MATSTKKQSTRGQINTIKTKNVDLELDDLVTKEDQELLKGVEDVKEMSFDVEASGNDIPESEILAFLKKLKVDKYRPIEGTDLQKKQSVKGKDGKEIKKNLEKGSPSVGSDPTKPSKKKNKEASVKLSTDKKQKKDKSISRQKAANGEKLIKNQDKSTVKSLLSFLKSVSTRKYLLIKPGDAWRLEEAYQLPDGPPDEMLVETAEKLAQRLFEEETLLFSKQRENVKNSEARWLKTVLSSGTLSDKMAALTLMIHESPLHSMASIDTLISMSSKKGKREAMMSVDTLRDLFLTGLLPDNRKLRTFRQQPILKLQELSHGNVDTRDKYLIMWYFEAQLKKKYQDFIKVLGEISFDTLLAMKEKALSTISQLLSKKPEQENVLLPMLVNKLGDPVIKSKAIYFLTKLVDEHPRMKPVIVREVQQLLHRPNVTERAQYYAICYLAQIRLSESEADLASQLIKIYFYFFQNYLKKKEVDNKMMSALLTGVNRAYVFAKGNKEEITQQTDAIYKIIPSVNFHTGVQALMLLQQVTDASASDRYYMCLYRKLVDPDLNTSSKQGIFMNLLFKSLKTDVVDRRIKAFIKRILQVYSTHPPHTICGVLILLSQILQNKAGLVQTRYKAEGAWAFDDDEEEHYVDYPAPSDEHEGNGDVSKVDPALIEPNTTTKQNSQQLDNTKENSQLPDNSNQNNQTKASWVHRVNYSGTGQSSGYDPYTRNPLYTHAETECTSELHQLTKHYHPTVRLYAIRLLQGELIEYDGDPVKDFTLSRFLDRFVYKNPKKQNERPTGVGQFIKSGPTGIRAVPINSSEYLEIEERDIPEDEKFFYRYFREKAIRKQDNDDVADDESISDDEFEAYLDSFEKSVDRDDIGDVDFDFASDQKKSTKSKDKEESSDTGEDFGDDDEDDLDLEDDELAAEFQQEMEELKGGMDSEEEDELHNLLHGGDKKRKKKSFDETGDEDLLLQEPKKKKKKSDTADLFASAEQFAHLLDEENETLQGGSSDLLNKDKAAKKQLAWEMDRDSWLHDKKGRPPKGKHWKAKTKTGKSFRRKNTNAHTKQIKKKKEINRNLKIL